MKTIDKIKNKYKQEANGDSISELIVNTNHGTIIRAGVTYKKSFYKSLLHSAYLESSAQVPINKNPKHLSLPDHKLTENLIFIFSFYERAKKR